MYVAQSQEILVHAVTRKGQIVHVFTVTVLPPPTVDMDVRQAKSCLLKKGSYLFFFLFFFK